MEPIETPELPVLNVEKAIKSLQDYINELEEQKSEELTDKQVKALSKFVQGLVSETETET